MVQRFYMDTSVFGGVFDEEFSEPTLMLFEKVTLGQVICMYSGLVEAELFDAPGSRKPLGFAGIMIKASSLLFAVSEDAYCNTLNVYRIRGYNAVNMREGYTQLEIRSPKDIVGYEN